MRKTKTKTPDFFVIKTKGKKYVKVGDLKRLEVNPKISSVRLFQIIEKLLDVMLTKKKKKRVYLKKKSSVQDGNTEGPKIFGHSEKMADVITENALRKQLMITLPHLSANNPIGYKIEEKEKKTDPITLELMKELLKQKDDITKLSLDNKKLKETGKLMIAKLNENQANQQEESSAVITSLQDHGFTSNGIPAGRRKLTPEALKERLDNAHRNNEANGPKYNGWLEKYRERAKKDYIYVPEEAPVTPPQNVASSSNVQEEEDEDIDEVQEGEGNIVTEPLNTLEIQRMMSKQKKNGFVGVFPSDKIKNIKLNKGVTSFIMNTDPSYKVGKHWVAIRIDDGVVEYFDSFGEEPTKQVTKDLIKLLPKHRGLYQFKINTVKRQENDSRLCGYHAMDFLKRRMKETFIKVTGFKKQNEEKRGEKEIQNVAQKVKEFGYI